MTAQFRPPAPKPPPPDRPWWRVLSGIRRNPLATWSQRAYEEPAVATRLLGRTYILLAEPAAVRHVLVENTANYRRPATARRLLRPGTGEGLLLAEGTAWRQQRRTLSPAFTPRAIDKLFPHFHAGAAAPGRDARQRSARASIWRASSSARPSTSPRARCSRSRSRGAAPRSTRCSRSSRRAMAGRPSGTWRRAMTTTSPGSSAAGAPSAGAGSPRSTG